MTQRSELGKLGEDKACEYLVENGFRIVERNFRKPWGELDIIALAPDKTLVFVEVKTMVHSGPAGITPENQMTAAKIRKLKRTASLYAGHKPEFIEDERGWRLDLITLTKYEKDFSIRHYQNIV